MILAWILATGRTHQLLDLRLALIIGESTDF